VVKVHDLTGTEFVHREMALIKVMAKAEHRAEILRIVDIFRCKVVDVSLDHYTIEVTGDEGKMKAILNLLKPSFKTARYQGHCKNRHHCAHRGGQVDTHRRMTKRIEN